MKKLGILIAVVLVAGLFAGIMLPRFDSAADSPGTTDTAKHMNASGEGEAKISSEGSSVPLACLEELPCQDEAEPPTDAEDSDSCEPCEPWSNITEDLEEILDIDFDDLNIDDILNDLPNIIGDPESKCWPHPTPGLKLSTGVITDIEQENGNITSIELVNLQCEQVGFQIANSTRFYYEEGIPQDPRLNEGDLVTVVCRPWLCIHEYSPQALDSSGKRPLQMIREKLAEAWEAKCVPEPAPTPSVASMVIVHAPRPSIIWGKVTGIDLGEKTLEIASTQGDVKVRVNSCTRYVFLPRPCPRPIICPLPAEGDCCQDVTEVPSETDCIKRPGLENILVGDKVIVYAPTVGDDGIRIAHTIVVLPRPALQKIQGRIVEITDESITLCTCADDTSDTDCSCNADSTSETDCSCHIAFKYNTSTIFTIYGKPEAEVGDQATAWCYEDPDGNLVARRVTIR